MILALFGAVVFLCWAKFFVEWARTQNEKTLVVAKCMFGLSVGIAVALMIASFWI